MRRRSAETAHPSDRWTWAQFLVTIAKFAWHCAYCGERFTETPEPDHVIPVSRGGRNLVANLLPACRACNCDKRDLLLHEWGPDRARRGLPPRQTQFDDDPRCTHLTFATA